MAFICGVGNQEDAYEDLCMLPSTPQRKLTRRRHSFGSRTNKDNKNPYSNRGLEKFEALLADLDGKRQKIYTQKGSEDISLIRFVYTNANDVKPIVVKIKDPRKQDKDHKQKLEGVKPPVLWPSGHTASGDTVKQAVKDANEHGYRRVLQNLQNPYQLTRKLGEWWRPWYSLPLFVILILVLLVFFGRSFAIVCTSIGWYLVPAINSSSTGKMSHHHVNLKKTVKKEYSRKSSDTMITSPRSVLSGPMNPEPHRRSF